MALQKLICLPRQSGKGVSVIGWRIAAGVTELLTQPGQCLEVCVERWLDDGSIRVGKRLWFECGPGFPHE